MIWITERLCGNSTDAICGSLTQAFATLSAGLLAFTAGCLAYRAATRQTRIHERHQKAERDAFRFRLGFIVDELLIHSLVMLVQAHELKAKPGNWALPSIGQFDIPDELHPRRWRDHALTTPDIVKALHDVYSNLLQANEFLDDIEKNHLKAEDFAFSPTLADKPPKELPDGSVEFETDSARVQFLKLAKTLNDSLKLTKRLLGTGKKKSIFRKAAR